jgi:oxygen-dependent protoporphyrinogen oxidase
VPRYAIVGGGISGLATAHLLAARGHDVTLIDGAPAPGGLIASGRRSGFLCERGPQAVLDGPDETRALIAAAGLGARALPALPASRRRFVRVGGALRPFPASPPALIKTNLFSARGKLRLLAEPFIRRAAADADESIADFVARRFGREAAERAAAPALIGVFAGDAATLSVRAALPRLAALEREHGSVLRGLRRARRAGRPGLGRPVSFPDGLGELPAALAAALGARRIAARAEAIERAGAGWRVAVAGHAPVEAERVVVATPAATTAALLAPHAPDAAAALLAIPHAPIAVVSLGFHAADGLGMDLDAYGFVVARGEGIALLGCQYETSVFPGRAPGGGVLLRALVGGSFAPALVDADDGALVSLTLGDLGRAAGLARDPDFADVWRARPGIPQYDMAHAARVATVDDAVAALPGLTVIGNALRGVGVNDCIRAATEVAARA